MSYGISIDRSPATPNDPDLLAITINGVRQVVNFSRRDYSPTASLPDRLVVNGHHVHDGEVGVEWVTAHVNSYGPTTVNGEPTVRPVIQATSQSGGAKIDRRRPEPDPGDTARDMTPEEIAALAAEVRADWEAESQNDPDVDSDTDNAR